jgi:cyclin G-associated kinase
MQIKAGRLLGEGGFAFVYEAMDVATGRAVCLKRMIIGSNQSAEDTARKEIRLMQQLSGNPEIVTYFGSSVVEHGSSKDAYIVMEFCQSGHLFGVLQKMASENRLFPPREAARLMAQVAAGLRVLHAQTPPVAHRDIKLENILVTAENACKLCDFGSAAVGAQSVKSQSERSTQEELIEKNTTQMYRAPEMCDLFSLPRNGTLDEAVDIWALGCVFYAMLFLVHPFQVGSVGGSIF